MYRGYTGMLSTGGLNEYARKMFMLLKIFILNIQCFLGNQQENIVILCKNQ